MDFGLGPLAFDAIVDKIQNPKTRGLIYRDVSQIVASLGQVGRRIDS
jgi:hypothetical protein